MPQYPSKAAKQTARKEARKRPEHIAAKKAAAAARKKRKPK